MAWFFIIKILTETWVMELSQLWLDSEWGGGEWGFSDNHPPLPTDVTGADSSWSGQRDWQTTTVQTNQVAAYTKEFWLAAAREEQQEQREGKNSEPSTGSPLEWEPKRSTMKYLVLVLLSCYFCSLISLGGKTLTTQHCSGLWWRTVANCSPSIEPGD